MTGKGLKIAVIDSGVNARHPHICAPTRGIVFDPLHSDESCEDHLGHGTAVTAAIQEKAPGAEYFILKLFDHSLRTTTSRLMKAIEWTIDNGMHIVNLSLGTTSLEYRTELEFLVNRAVAAQVVLVSAKSAARGPILPGILGGVIGVDVDWELPREVYSIRYDDTGSPCFFASGYPRALPGMPQSRNLSGISFAVANMTGFIARACEGLERRSFDRVFRELASRTENVPA